MLDNCVLIITGCVVPNNQQRTLFLSNPIERKKQYIESIKYYIESKQFKKIIYCDNSNYDIDEKCFLRECAKDNGVEFENLFFEGNIKETLIRGKGYGEGEIIKYALLQSDLISNAEMIVKVTGRLIVKNISDIMPLIQPGLNYFNLDVYSDGLDTRFYICSLELYKSLLENLYEITDNRVSYSIEKAFYDKMRGNKYYRDIPRFPDFDGISGGNGKNYGAECRFRISWWSMLCRFNMFNRYRELRHIVGRYLKKIKKIVK